MLRFFPAGRWQTFIFATRMLPASGTGRKRPPKWLRTTQPPLFRLAWYVSPSARRDRKPAANEKAGDRSPIRKFSHHSRRSGGGRRGGIASAGGSSKDSTETLLGACDWLLEHQRPDLALAALEWPCGTDIATPRLARVPRPVTNGSFGKSPISHGFDWRLTTVEGVSSFLNVNPNALGFEFSGEEPDSFTLMSQTAPVLAQRDYVLAVDYATSGIAPGSGIAMAGDRRANRRSAGAGRRASPRSKEDTAHACFTAPEGTPSSTFRWFTSASRARCGWRESLL